MPVTIIGFMEAPAMRWVTREKAKVDRIACPWLIKHFVDKKSEFLFVPSEKVHEVAGNEGAIPFDSPGVELTHYKEDGEEFVSFGAIEEIQTPRSCSQRAGKDR